MKKYDKKSADQKREEIENNDLPFISRSILQNFKTKARMNSEIPPS